MLEISRQDIIRSLQRDNPWWKAIPSPEGTDFTKRRAYYESFKSLVLNWDVRRSTILMGPRRIGKTVMLKQFITDCIKDSFNPNSILFASLDTPLYSGLSLDQLVQLFEEDRQHDPNAQRIIIFDEIQYLSDWQVHLKVITDQYPNTKFIASGSAGAALRKQSQESGAGRFTDFILPPLTFSEFLDFRETEESLVEYKYTNEVFTLGIRDQNELNLEFIRYLNFGGFPEAVTAEDIQDNFQRYVGRDIVDKVLLRDLPNLYGIQNTQELNRLFTMLAYHSGQEISLDGLATSSGVAKNTISRYLDYLEAAFLIFRVSRVDERGNSFKRMRSFKAYLTNPSMRAALFGPLTAGSESLGPMVETAVFCQWFHSETLRDIHYARWKKGRKYLEVDCVAVRRGTQKPFWAYEIKWSDRYYSRPGELRGLIEFAKANDLHAVAATSLTKSGTTDIEGVSIKHIPCALHCYGIGKSIAKGDLI